MAGFLAFLYLIPPFDLVSPESLIAPRRPRRHRSHRSPIRRRTRSPSAAKYIVMISGCVDCHSPPGPNGPDFSRYMGGGLKTSFKGHGTFVSANLTPDRADWTRPPHG